MNRRQLNSRLIESAIERRNHDVASTNWYDEAVQMFEDKEARRIASDRSGLAWRLHDPRFAKLAQVVVRQFPKSRAKTIVAVDSRGNVIEEKEVHT